MLWTRGFASLLLLCIASTTRCLVNNTQQLSRKGLVDPEPVQMVGSHGSERLLIHQHREAELPLFCSVPQASRKPPLPPASTPEDHPVAMIEGGLKSHVLALLLDRVPVIGAEEGAFHKSPNMLREYLIRLKATRCVQRALLVVVCVEGR